MSARRVLLAAIASVALAVPACNSGQDPGLEPTDANDGADTTSNTLGQCPPDGPDATTPAAGCLDDEGNVVTP